MKKKGKGCLWLFIYLSMIGLGCIAGMWLMVYLLNKDLKWGYLFFPLIFLGAIYAGRKEDKEKKKELDNYREAGELIFGDRAAFNEACEAFWKKKKGEPIDVLIEFAEDTNVMHVVDWRGEDNEGEVEEFVERMLGQKIAWTRVAQLRKDIPVGDQRDGNFIFELLFAVDKDLKAAGARLLFLGLSDNYQYMVVSSEVLKRVRRLKLDGVRGAEDLEDEAEQD